MTGKQIWTNRTGYGKNTGGTKQKMGAQLTTWLTIVGSVIELVAAVGYVRSILRGKSRPHPVSWFIWSIIGAAGLSTAIAGGAGMSMLIIGILLAVELVVGFLSLKPKFANENVVGYDIPLAIVAVGLILGVSRLHFSPVTAALVAIVIDVIAVFPTVRAHWNKPNDQVWPWFAGGVAFTLSAIAVSKFTFAALAFPVYLAVSNFVIAWTLAGRPKKLTVKHRRQIRRALKGSSV